MFVTGDKLTDATKSWIEPLAPGKEVNVSIEMVSPAEKGIYQSRWQLNTSSGIPFGGIPFHYSLQFLKVVFGKLSLFIHRRRLTCELLMDFTN